MRDFRDLKVWERSHQLTLGVYSATKVFPQDERFGLTSQLRRAAASIASNLAEGCGRDGSREFLQFLRIAAGSASEVEYHLLLARDLGYLETDRYTELQSLACECKRMLASFIDRIRSEIGK